MKKTDRHKSRVYRDRADYFFKTMQYCAEDRHDANSPLWNSVGLLAVHSAIALADAIAIAKTGMRPTADDHQDAAAVLERICKKGGLDSGGVKHFRSLLSRKSDFAYGEQRIETKALEQALLQARRFQEWAYKTFADESGEFRNGT